jgi:CHAT domain-containing protein
VTSTHATRHAVERLIDADAASRDALLAALHADESHALATALKATFDTYKNSDITRARPAADVLDLLAERFAQQPEVQALARWTRASLLIREGEPAEALPQLEAAHALFAASGDARLAAETHITTVYALGVMGRYAEAIGVALHAREAFAGADDDLQRASIDLNLGNIYHFSGEFGHAIDYYERAELVFAGLGEVDLQLGALNNRADALVEQGRYDDAVTLHEQALRLAEQHRDYGQIALSHNNLGYLYAHQGVYHRSIACFQEAFAAFGRLGMGHEQKMTELELVEAYLFLNLLDEVIYRCQALVDYFAQHELRFEHARALALLGLAQSRVGNREASAVSFEQSERAFASIGSRVWAAYLQLCRADLALNSGNLQVAAQLASSAATVYRAEGLRGRLAQALWLRGEALRLDDQLEAALPLLQAAQAQAEELLLAMLLPRCATSYGLLARAQGRLAEARAAFEQAVTLAEEQRAPLPAEEFRVAYFADQLTPYRELVRLALEAGDAADAFAWVERARGRALLDIFDEEGGAARQIAADTTLVARRQALRRSLKFHYDRLNRPSEDDLDTQAIARLEQEVLALERELLAIDRTLRADGGGGARPLGLEEVQQHLDAETQLLVYWADGDQVSAILVSSEGATLCAGMAATQQVTQTLERLQFQISKFRYAPEYLAQHGQQLGAATDRQLARLYQLLIAPLAARLRSTRLIVVPHGVLHYVPFAALHDGTGYLVERLTISLLPAASTLPACRARPERPLACPLLVGVPDAAVPSVADEIGALGRLFPQAKVLLGRAAREQELRAALADADALHLACHGVFRSASPLFSALKLDDGWLTVRDISSLDLRSCQLVTLSACETGVSYVAPGDELLGLTRGVLAAGARALLASQWPADDRHTAQLMERFYTALQQDGVGFAAALRQAQLDVLARAPHPFYWAAFFAVAA